MAVTALSKCFRHLTASNRLCLKRFVWKRCLSTINDDTSEPCDIVISGGGMVGAAMACALGILVISNGTKFRTAVLSFSHALGL